MKKEYDLELDDFAVGALSFNVEDDSDDTEDADIDGDYGYLQLNYLLKFILERQDI